MKHTGTLQCIAYAFIALWGYAGSIKLIHWVQSRAEMHKQPFPAWVADILFWAIPFAELGIVALLLVPKLRVWGLRASLALITLFTLYLALVLGRAFGSIPCACGGILSGMGHAEHLAFNSLFTILGCTAMVLTHKSRHRAFAKPRCPQEGGAHI
ncbi:MauE/DoxX family redox-associated membrane protein [Parapedobacter koreensis]|uniref:Methylamine utilisation protein MauE n=1 Tax=Parapedobacter koreensis TaxID=332977 RepID=A0A1H7RD60_9SPHI|nr:MauE/DoxX family redox-associated membrane protein [Parapedobacter koreensis]SEL57377.1 Methylamine utilisation protein MauE [Parapedobacter koreensis]